MNSLLRNTYLVAGFVFLAGCGSPTTETSTTSEAVSTTTSTTTGEPPTTTTEEPVREGSDTPAAGVTVTREEAEQIALDAVGSGTVTWSGPEDDRGAAWEVEITRPDGTEVDVLIGPNGTVIKQVEKHGTAGAPVLTGAGDTSGGVVTEEEAAAAALAAVGEGRVTWIGREDERGAAWEVEVTRPDGREIDVLVAADGSIVP